MDDTMPTSHCHLKSGESSHKEVTISCLRDPPVQIGGSLGLCIAPTGRFFRSDILLPTHVGVQRQRDAHAAIELLVYLEDGDQDAWRGNGRVVQCMHEPDFVESASFTYWVMHIIAYAWHVMNFPMPALSSMGIVIFPITRNMMVNCYLILGVRLIGDGSPGAVRLILGGCRGTPWSTNRGAWLSSGV